MSFIKSPISWSEHTLHRMKRWILIFGVFLIILLYFNLNRYTLGFFLLYLFFAMDAVAFRLQLGKVTDGDLNSETYVDSNESEVNKEILALLMKIQHRTPELSKYLGEMPVILKNGSNKVDIENLRDYYDSLQNLLKNYLSEHENVRNR